MNLNRYRIMKNGEYVFHTFLKGQDFNSSIWLENDGRFIKKEDGSYAIFYNEDGTINLGLELNKLLSDIDKAVEKHLDDEARAYGYTTGTPIVTVISYKDSTNPTWAAEGTMFNKWRDAVYQYMQTQLALIENNQRSLPTPEEAILELPKVEDYANA